MRKARLALGLAPRAALIAATLCVPRFSAAQGPAPLPPLPPPGPQQPPPGEPAPPPPQGYPPPQTYPPPQGYPPPQSSAPPAQPYPYAQPQYDQPLPPYPGQPLPPPPPPVEYNEPPVPTHAPKFSLFAGARLGYLGFGGFFFNNELGKGETTGNFLGNGVTVGADVGVRLGKRYVPYLFLEHGFMGSGHRFEGADATSSTDLMGVGFRYTAGDVDSVGFLTDISVGMRSVTVKSGTETYKMSTFEFFRLGLGAEIRISTLFVLSPMATLSGGSMTDSEGTVHYSAAGSADYAAAVPGRSPQPTFSNGAPIDNTRGYVVVGVHCGAHFDIFGK